MDLVELENENDSVNFVVGLIKRLLQLMSTTLIWLRTRLRSSQRSGNSNAAIPEICTCYCICENKKVTNETHCGDNVSLSADIDNIILELEDDTDVINRIVQIDISLRELDKVIAPCHLCEDEPIKKDEINNDRSIERAKISQTPKTKADLPTKGNKVKPVNKNFAKVNTHQICKDLNKLTKCDCLSTKCDCTKSKVSNNRNSIEASARSNREIPEIFLDGLSNNVPQLNSISLLSGEQSTSDNISKSFDKAKHNSPEQSKTSKSVSYAAKSNQENIPSTHIQGINSFPKKSKITAEETQKTDTSFKSVSGNQKDETSQKFQSILQSSGSSSRHNSVKNKVTKCPRKSNCEFHKSCNTSTSFQQNENFPANKKFIKPSIKNGSRVATTSKGPESSRSFENKSKTAETRLQKPSSPVNKSKQLPNNECSINSSNEYSPNESCKNKKENKIALVESNKTVKKQFEKSITTPSQSYTTKIKTTNVELKAAVETFGSNLPQQSSSRANKNEKSKNGYIIIKEESRLSSKGQSQGISEEIEDSVDLLENDDETENLTESMTKHSDNASWMTAEKISPQLKQFRSDHGADNEGPIILSVGLPQTTPENLTTVSDEEYWKTGNLGASSTKYSWTTVEIKQRQYTNGQTVKDKEESKVLSEGRFQGIPDNSAALSDDDDGEYWETENFRELTAKHSDNNSWMTAEIKWSTRNLRKSCHAIKDDDKCRVLSETQPQINPENSTAITDNDNDESWETGTPVASSTKYSKNESWMTAKIKLPKNTNAQKVKDKEEPKVSSEERSQRIPDDSAALTDDHGEQYWETENFRELTAKHSDNNSWMTAEIKRSTQSLRKSRHAVKNYDECRVFSETRSQINPENSTALTDSDDDEYWETGNPIASSTKYSKNESWMTAKIKLPKNTNSQSVKDTEEPKVSSEERSQRIPDDSAALTDDDQEEYCETENFRESTTKHSDNNSWMTAEIKRSTQSLRKSRHAVKNYDECRVFSEMRPQIDPENSTALTDSDDDECWETGNPVASSTKYSKNESWMTAKIKLPKNTNSQSAKDKKEPKVSSEERSQSFPDESAALTDDDEEEYWETENFRELTAKHSDNNSWVTAEIKRSTQSLRKSRHAVKNYDECRVFSETRPQINPENSTALTDSDDDECWETGNPVASSTKYSKNESWMTAKIKLPKHTNCQSVKDKEEPKVSSEERSQRIPDESAALTDDDEEEYWETENFRESTTKHSDNNSWVTAEIKRSTQSLRKSRHAVKNYDECRVLSETRPQINPENSTALTDSDGDECWETGNPVASSTKYSKNESWMTAEIKLPKRRQHTNGQSVEDKEEPKVYSEERSQRIPDDSAALIDDDKEEYWETENFRESTTKHSDNNSWMTAEIKRSTQSLRKSRHAVKNYDECRVLSETRPQINPENSTALTDSDDDEYWETKNFEASSTKYSKNDSWTTAEIKLPNQRQHATGQGEKNKVAIRISSEGQSQRISEDSTDPIDKNNEVYSKTEASTTNNAWMTAEIKCPQRKLKKDLRVSSEGLSQESNDGEETWKSFNLGRPTMTQSDNDSSTPNNEKPRPEISVNIAKQMENYENGSGSELISINSNEKMSTKPVTSEGYSTKTKPTDVNLNTIVENIGTNNKLITLESKEKNQLEKTSPKPSTSKGYSTKIKTTFTELNTTKESTVKTVSNKFNNITSQNVDAKSSVYTPSHRKEYKKITSKVNEMQTEQARGYEQADANIKYNSNEQNLRVFGNKSEKHSQSEKVRKQTTEIPIRTKMVSKGNKEQDIKSPKKNELSIRTSENKQKTASDDIKNSLYFKPCLCSDERIERKKNIRNEINSSGKTQEKELVQFSLLPEPETKLSSSTETTNGSVADLLSTHVSNLKKPEISNISNIPVLVKIKIPRKDVTLNKSNALRVKMKTPEKSTHREDNISYSTNNFEIAEVKAKVAIPEEKKTNNQQPSNQTYSKKEYSLKSKEINTEEKKKVIIEMSDLGKTEEKELVSFSLPSNVSGQALQISNKTIPNNHTETYSSEDISWHDSHISINKHSTFHVHNEQTNERGSVFADSSVTKQSKVTLKLNSNTSDNSKDITDKNKTKQIILEKLQLEQRSCLTEETDRDLENSFFSISQVSSNTLNLNKPINANLSNIPVMLKSKLPKKYEAIKGSNAVTSSPPAKMKTPEQQLTHTDNISCNTTSLKIPEAKTEITIPKEKRANNFDIRNIEPETKRQHSPSKEYSKKENLSKPKELNISNENKCIKEEFNQQKTFARINSTTKKTVSSKGGVVDDFKNKNSYITPTNLLQKRETFKAGHSKGANICTEEYRKQDDTDQKNIVKNDDELLQTTTKSTDDGNAFVPNITLLLNLNSNNNGSRTAVEIKNVNKNIIPNQENLTTRNSLHTTEIKVHEKQSTVVADKTNYKCNQNSQREASVNVTTTTENKKLKNNANKSNDGDIGKEKCKITKQYVTTDKSIATYKPDEIDSLSIVPNENLYFKKETNISTKHLTFSPQCEGTKTENTEIQNSETLACITEQTVANHDKNNVIGNIIEETNAALIEERNCMSAYTDKSGTSLLTSIDNFEIDYIKETVTVVSDTNATVTAKVKISEGMVVQPFNDENYSETKLPASTIKSPDNESSCTADIKLPKRTQNKNRESTLSENRKTVDTTAELYNDAGENWETGNVGISSTEYSNDDSWMTAEIKMPGRKQYINDQDKEGSRVSTEGRSQIIPEDSTLLDNDDEDYWESKNLGAPSTTDSKNQSWMTAEIKLPKRRKHTSDQVSKDKEESRVSTEGRSQRIPDSAAALTDEEYLETENFRESTTKQSDNNSWMTAEIKRSTRNLRKSRHAIKNYDECRVLSETRPQINPENSTALTDSVDDECWETGNPVASSTKYSKNESWTTAEIKLPNRGQYTSGQVSKDKEETTVSVQRIPDGDGEEYWEIENFRESTTKQSDNNSWITAEIKRFTQNLRTGCHAIKDDEDSRVLSETRPQINPENSTALTDSYNDEYWEIGNPKASSTKYSKNGSWMTVEMKLPKRSQHANGQGVKVKEELRILTEQRSQSMPEDSKSSFFNDDENYWKTDNLGATSTTYSKNESWTTAQIKLPKRRQSTSGQVSKDKEETTVSVQRIPDGDGEEYWETENFRESTTKQSDNNSWITAEIKRFTQNLRTGRHAIKDDEDAKVLSETRPQKNPENSTALTDSDDDDCWETGNPVASSTKYSKNGSWKTADIKLPKQRCQGVKDKKQFRVLTQQRSQRMREDSKSLLFNDNENYWETENLGPTSTTCSKNESWITAEIKLPKQRQYTSGQCISDNEESRLSSEGRSQRYLVDLATLTGDDEAEYWETGNLRGSFTKYLNDASWMTAEIKLPKRRRPTNDQVAKDEEESRVPTERQTQRIPENSKTQFDNDDAEYWETGNLGISSTKYSNDDSWITAKIKMPGRKQYINAKDKEESRVSTEGRSQRIPDDSATLTVDDNAEYWETGNLRGSFTKYSNDASWVTAEIKLPKRRRPTNDQVAKDKEESRVSTERQTQRIPENSKTQFDNDDAECWETGNLRGLSTKYSDDESWITAEIKLPKRRQSGQCIRHNEESKPSSEGRSQRYLVDLATLTGDDDAENWETGNLRGSFTKCSNDASWMTAEIKLPKRRRPTNDQIAKDEEESRVSTERQTQRIPENSKTQFDNDNAEYWETGNLRGSSTKYSNDESWITAEIKLPKRRQYTSGQCITDNEESRLLSEGRSQRILVDSVTLTGDDDAEYWVTGNLRGSFTKCSNDASWMTAEIKLPKRRRPTNDQIAKDEEESRVSTERQTQRIPENSKTQFDNDDAEYLETGNLGISSTEYSNDDSWITAKIKMPGRQQYINYQDAKDKEESRVSTEERSQRIPDGSATLTVDDNVEYWKTGNLRGSSTKYSNDESWITAEIKIPSRDQHINHRGAKTKEEFRVLPEKRFQKASEEIQYYIDQFDNADEDWETGHLRETTTMPSDNDSWITVQIKLPEKKQYTSSSGITSMVQNKYDVDTTFSDGGKYMITRNKNLNSSDTGSWITAEIIVPGKMRDINFEKNEEIVINETDFENVVSGNKPLKYINLKQKKLFRNVKQTESSTENTHSCTKQSSTGEQTRIIKLLTDNNEDGEENDENDENKNISTSKRNFTVGYCFVKTPGIKIRENRLKANTSVMNLRALFIADIDKEINKVKIIQKSFTNKARGHTKVSKSKGNVLNIVIEQESSYASVYLPFETEPKLKIRNSEHTPKLQNDEVTIFNWNFLKSDHQVSDKSTQILKENTSVKSSFTVLKHIKHVTEEITCKRLKTSAYKHLHQKTATLDVTKYYDASIQSSAKNTSCQREINGRPVSKSTRSRPPPILVRIKKVPHKCHFDHENLKQTRYGTWLSQIAFTNKQFRMANQYDERLGMQPDSKTHPIYKSATVQKVRTSDVKNSSFNKRSFNSSRKSMKQLRDCATNHGADRMPISVRMKMELDNKNIIYIVNRRTPQRLLRYEDCGNCSSVDDAKRHQPILHRYYLDERPPYYCSDEI